MNNDVNKQGSDFTVAHPGPHNDLTATEALQYELSQRALQYELRQRALSRHSPEGFDEVLKSAQREDVKLVDIVNRNASEVSRERAKRAADLLDAWVRGETLEFREFASGGWMEYVGSLYMPNVTSPALEWRVKRTPRTVWLAFHEGGSVRDIRALEPDVNPDGPEYFEFEEKLG